MSLEWAGEPAKPDVKSSKHFSTSEGFPHWQDPSHRPAAFVTDQKARRWQAPPHVPPFWAASVLAAVPTMSIIWHSHQACFLGSPVSREGAPVTSKEREQPLSTLGSEQCLRLVTRQKQSFRTASLALSHRRLAILASAERHLLPHTGVGAFATDLGSVPAVLVPRRPAQVTADDEQSSAAALTALSAFIDCFFFSFHSWREANRIVKAFKNTNQRKLGFQALSRCYLPTVYFQESLGNHCHFSLRFGEKPSIWSGAGDLYLPLAKGKQSPVSVLKPRLTSVPWTWLPQPSSVPAVPVARVQALLVAVTPETGGDGVSLSLFRCHHPTLEWKSKCHFVVWKSPPVTSAWDMSPETRRPPSSWVTSVETGSVQLDCVLSSRSVVFGPSWLWVRIW